MVACHHGDGSHRWPPVILVKGVLDGSLVFGKYLITLRFEYIFKVLIKNSSNWYLENIEAILIL